MPNAVTFHLQDPTAPGLTLLDAVADAADGALHGGAIFAFASARGVTMLLDDPLVVPLTRKGGFELVVGSDAITDERALDALAERLARRPALRARVLVHGLPTLFHPKLCWFRHADRLELVVGSGNLTPGGLSGNLEAFMVSRLDGAAATAAQNPLDAWLARWDANLFAPDAAEAVRAAKTNSGAERSLKRSMRREDEDPPSPLPVALDAECLVLEIPRNAPRRAQLDVGQSHFRAFFGGAPGRRKRISIQHVDGQGRLEEVEPARALIETKSDNYRFEAGAGRGIEYPAAGRPIAVFVRMPDGIFRYRLLWPGDRGHAQVEAFLTARAGPAGGSMRREPATTAELRTFWPNAPELLLP